MKKFTLVAGLVAFATIGSVFAAWTFESSGTLKDEDSLANGVGVVLSDTNIETDGISGVLSLSNSGDKLVKIVQGTPEEYTFKVEEYGSQELFTATYTPGIGEQINNYDYLFEFKFDITYDNHSITYSIVKKGTASTGDKKISFNDEGILVATSDLSPIFKQEKALTRIGLAAENLEAMKLWLEAKTTHASKLCIEVSLTLNPTAKSVS